MNTSTRKTNGTEGPLPSSRSPAAVAADNLFRRVLKISNPYDAAEMAQGLTRFYTGEARELELEQAGLPFYRVETMRPTVRDTEGPIGAELQQAKDDVDRDFNSLLHNPLLKDIYPELRGWESAIGSVIAEGVNAARCALDPRQRDYTFSARRQLGEYARIVRFVGAVTPDLNQHYRGLAQSLDEVANVLLVMTGEALARVGFSGGTFLLQTPAGELHTRRDAVLMALRNLTGTAQYAHGPADWPHGLAGYRRLVEHLDRSGQADLRVLLDEATLLRLMDGLLDLATANNADSLRALGATAMPTIERLKRLVRTAETIPDLDSPPLSAFEMALELFCNSFLGAGGGVRLLSIARPAILSYGLLGFAGQDPVTQRLQNIVIGRNQLAHLLDCYFGCSCDLNQLHGQIILDKILADVDRAIDLYCLSGGPDQQNEPEIRAAAYGCLIATVLNFAAVTLEDNQTPWPELWTKRNMLNSTVDPANVGVLNLLTDTETAINALVKDLKYVRLDNDNDVSPPTVLTLPNAVSTHLRHVLRDLANSLLNALPDPVVDSVTPQRMKVIAEPQRTLVAEMLNFQEDAETQWANQLTTMAPSCHLPDQLRQTTLHLIWLTRLAWCGQARVGHVQVEVPGTLTSIIGNLSEALND